jgi:hypothetical protein
MNKKAFRHNLDLSKALAREHLEQAGHKSTAKNPAQDPRLQPLCDAINNSASAKSPAGVSKKLIKKLAAA